ncbi:MAG TPA: ABC transporter ATP-binding protein [Rhizomicrobium sp.]|nr:ABC transporter ATP-binding protein [Rhizomicrobium sp.]
MSGVTKYYKRGAEKVEVLENLDLEVPKGDFLALMAPSGKGKSTLLSLIGGIDRPSAGDVTVDGKSLKKMRDGALAAWRSRNIGFVFQLYHLMPALTAAQNVELPLLLTKMSAAERRKRTLAALAVTDMDDRANFKPAELSGGQQQRVAIARAIVTDPPILVCDEPTGDLDRKTGDEILRLLQTLNTEHGKTILMVTHDPHAAARAGRTLFLAGRKLAEEPEA